MNNQQGPTVHHRKLCSMLCGSLEGKEGSLEENGYMCMYSWAPLLFIWNYQNMVCLSAILKYKIKSLKKFALDMQGNEMPLRSFWQRLQAWKDSILESSLWLLLGGRIRVKSKWWSRCVLPQWSSGDRRKVWTGEVSRGRVGRVKTDEKSA